LTRRSSALSRASFVPHLCAATEWEEEVKSEEGEVVMQDGDEGRSALAAVEAPIPDRPQMDVALLHCQACLLPLKPPFSRYGLSCISPE
jgi:hypothetical protein